MMKFKIAFASFCLTTLFFVQFVYAHPFNEIHLVKRGQGDAAQHQHRGMRPEPREDAARPPSGAPVLGMLVPQPHGSAPSQSVQRPLTPQPHTGYAPGPNVQRPAPLYSTSSPPRHGRDRMRPPAMQHGPPEYHHGHGSGRPPSPRYGRPSRPSSSSSGPGWKAQLAGAAAFGGAMGEMGFQPETYVATHHTAGGHTSTSTGTMWAHNNSASTSDGPDPISACCGACCGWIIDACCGGNSSSSS